MNIVLLFFLVKSFLIAAPIVQASQCGVVPIEKWGLTPSRRKDELPKPVNLVVVTHTVTRECSSDEECEGIMRAIRNSHTANGMKDISLSFVVGGNGKIYEGAGWNVGAHTLNYNDKSISLSFIGDFSNKLPSPAALEAAKNFLGCFLNTRYLGCEYGLVGHRQLTSTLSPGDKLHSHIQTWPHWVDTPRV